MFHLNRVGKMCVAVGLLVGFLTWVVQALVFAKHPLATGIFSLIGTAATSATDILYRVLNHREKGLVRLLHCDCGGTYLSIPVWCLGLMFFTAFGHWLFFER